MTPRGAFLAALFQKLDEQSVSYCVLRNYENLYEDNFSDVDLAVQREDIARLGEALGEAAAVSGHHLVQRTRFINHSRVYWHSEGGFVRVDYDTEFRWRIFPVLTAKSVVTLRRKHGDFYVPHPRHESAILFLAAIERGKLSERYQQRLAALREERVTDEELKRTFRAAFGNIGEELAAAHSKMSEQMPLSSLLTQARRSIIRSSVSKAWKRRELWRNLRTDFGRLLERTKAPAGISLLHVSSAPSQEKLNDALQQLDPLFPKSKQVVTSVQGSSAKGTWQRLRALFKGGLFVRSLKAGTDAELAKLARKQTPLMFGSRTFVWAETSNGSSFVAHVGSGTMSEAPILQFIPLTLERLLAAPRPPRRGAFVVLVGLDGSGKTTVAREICAQIRQSERFRQVRYYHWRPLLFGRAELPLPEFRNVPRKSKLNGSLWQSLLSAARLLKNVLLWSCAHYFRVQRNVTSGGLVVVDRYYYNYHLDPVSVRYYGPASLLDRLSRSFPRPDVVVVLRAPMEVLLARKQELSLEEIARQNAVLDRMDFRAERVLTIDATQSAEAIARDILAKLDGA
jgi:thymidylate kinase